MLGCQDFCGYYEWTFHYLRRRFGKAALEKYWSQAVAADAQQHYIEAARNEGLRGLYKSWSKTGIDEECDWTVSLDEAEQVLRLDMRSCPSKGFLLDHDLNADEDYCDHCVGWIGPALEIVGAEVVAHVHNHCGQCRWQIGKKGAAVIPNCDGMSVLHDERWLHGYLHRFEANRPVAQDAELCPDSVDYLKAAFVGFNAVQIQGVDFDLDQEGEKARIRVAAISTDSAYILHNQHNPRLRAVVLGHGPKDWQQIAKQWVSTPRLLRPLLLHPFFPDSVPVPFPQFGLPRPLPLLPFLIRQGMYEHRPGERERTVQELTTVLKLALEKLFDQPLTDVTVRE